MTWNVEHTDEFEQDFWLGLGEAEQEAVAASVSLLDERGPNLPFPHSSGIARSRHGHMRELRVQSGGKPIRIFYAFVPRRAAILLIVATRRATTGFTRKWCPPPTGFMTCISTS